MKGADIIIGEFYGVTSKVRWDEPTYVSGRKAQVLAVNGGIVTVRYDGADRDSKVRTVDVKAPWAEVEAKKVAAQECATRRHEARAAAAERSRLADEAWVSIAPKFNKALDDAGITGVRAHAWRTGTVDITPDSLVLLTALLKTHALEVAA